MINHARNILCQGAQCGEFVPAEFRRALKSSVATNKIWITLLSTDERQLPGRVQQLMQLLHSTELSEYVLALDPRVTYLPFDKSLFGWQAQATLPEILVNLQNILTREDEDAIFGENPVEPYKTFRKHWRENSNIAYSLGSLVLAAIYRVNEQEE